ncbi:MAG: hypothetical protein HYU64_00345 [Armatimonadetes bacterium]|nr:hypothetical protein [Armatimonadota bacterium]
MKRRALLVLCFLFVASPLFAEDDPLAIIRKALEQKGKISFSARKTLKVFRPRELEVIMQIRQLGGQGSRVQFLSPGPLANDFLVDDGKFQWYYSDRRKQAFRFPSSLRMGKRIPKSFERLTEHFRFELLGSEEIGGREAYKIQVSPAGGRRGGRVVWIDRQEYLLLRVDRLKPNGETVASTSLSDITLNPRLSPKEFVFKAPGNAEVVTDLPNINPRALAQLEHRTGLSLMVPSHLPEGFRFSGAKLVPFQGKQAVQILFSGESGKISLFQARADPAGKEPRQKEMREREGKTFWIIRWTEGGREVALVGDLPLEELERVASSLKDLPENYLLEALRETQF